MYKAILFDLDDTLLDFSQSQTQGLKIIYTNYFSRHLTENQFVETYHSINKQLWYRVEAGTLQLSHFKIERFRLLIEIFKLTLSPHAIAETYEQALSDANWYPEVRNALCLLSQHYRLGIITNGWVSIQQKKILASGLDKLCVCYIIAETIGVAKPHKKIFDVALDQLDLSHNEVLMVGDSVESDYKGAMNAKLDFCWVNQQKEILPSELPLPKYVISSVAQLPNLLLKYKI